MGQKPIEGSNPSLSATYFRFAPFYRPTEKVGASLGVRGMTRSLLRGRRWSRRDEARARASAARRSNPSLSATYFRFAPFYRPTGKVRASLGVRGMTPEPSPKATVVPQGRGAGARQRGAPKQSLSLRHLLPIRPVLPAHREG